MNPHIPFSKSELYITNENIRFRIFHSRHELEIYENAKLIGSVQKAISGNAFGPLEYTLADGSELSISGAFKPKICVVKVNGKNIFPHHIKIDNGDREKLIQATFMFISQLIFFLGFWSFTRTENRFIQDYGEVNFAVGFLLLFLMYLTYQKMTNFVLYLFPIALTIPFFYSLFNNFHFIGILYPLAAIYLLRHIRKYRIKEITKID